MDKPKIFYEDNKIGKRNITILVVILSICVVGWTLAMVLSFVVPTPEDFSQNNFTDNLADNITAIVLLVLLAVTAIALFIFRFKSQRFKYAISLTDDEIRFAVPINNKEVFSTTELVSYEILDKLNAFARVKLVFTGDIVAIVKTRKFDEFKIALEYLLTKKNKTGSSKS